MGDASPELRAALGLDGDALIARLRRSRDSTSPLSELLDSRVFERAGWSCDVLRVSLEAQRDAEGVETRELTLRLAGTARVLNEADVENGLFERPQLTREAIEGFSANAPDVLERMRAVGGARSTSVEAIAIRAPGALPIDSVEARMLVRISYSNARGVFVEVPRSVVNFRPGLQFATQEGARGAVRWSLELPCSHEILRAWPRGLAPRWPSRARAVFVVERLRVERSWNWRGFFGRVAATPVTLVGDVAIGAFSLLWNVVFGDDEEEDEHECRAVRDLRVQP